MHYVADIFNQKTKKLLTQKDKIYGTTIHRMCVYVCQHYSTGSEMHFQIHMALCKVHWML